MTDHLLITASLLIFVCWIAAILTRPTPPIPQPNPKLDDRGRP